MPTRRPSGGSPEKDAGPTMLTVPRADLGQRLAEQIKRGRALLDRQIITKRRAKNPRTGNLVSAPSVNDAHFQKFRDDYHIWDEYNSTLIKRSFNTDQEHEQYANEATGMELSGGHLQQYQLLRKHLERQIHLLASLKERLPLFDEVSYVKTAVPKRRDDAALFDTEQAIFLVHGRDEASKHGVARFVRTITGREPIILAEQPALGQTIIESFEKYASQVSYAIVLATGDDEGRLIGEELLKPRARQNVILELGWLAGRLGRQKVALLYKRGVELPSDMGGVLYVELDPGEGWKLRLAREMRAAGLPVDMDKL